MSIEAAGLPQTWEVWPLSDVGQWLGGGTPSKSRDEFWQGSIPWVSPKDMKSHQIVDTKDHISKSAVDNSAAKMIPQNSVLFVTRSGILAHSFPVATAKNAVTVNQDLKAIVPNVAVGSEYLGWCLRALARDILNGCTKDGTTVHSIEVPSLKDFSIPVAPTNEQRRIVAKIEELFSELDKGIESLQTAKAQLQVYRQAILKHAFEGKLTAEWREANKDRLEPADHLLERIKSEREARYQQQLIDWKATVNQWEAVGKPGKKPTKPKKPESLHVDSQIELSDLPLGWGWARYGGLCEVVKNGISQKPEGNSGCKIFRISAVRPMEFDLNDVRYIDNSSGVFNEFRLETGDLVFTRYNGSRAYVGVCAQYISQEEHLYPDKLIRTKLGTPSVLSGFVEKAVSSGESRKYIETKIRTTAGQSGVSGGDVKNIPVPLCSEEEQAEILKVLEAELSKISSCLVGLLEDLRRCDALRQSILKKAFSGQLVPQDPNDEPASVLLERIKAEKSAVKKAKKGKAR
ncbi:restriction endonuclease subunit S [Magnetospira sp. QH-2]|uniref:restriction endonuclease subunit S n=1 Tax=Magnetospira sp. (strain QH-2) TaxID=1288970 RepID=UPI0003E80BC2|nr:restriction endonuclease subunit S [Magnetospira sp. QH-2]CCQ74232.1 Protein of unknown function [Magnetospira sp. QH-2]